MKLLVTGGAGFIGSNFIHYWLKNHPDDEIVNLDKLTYAGNLDNLKDIEKKINYKFIKGDICNEKLVKEVVREIDVIVHFAAESHVDRSILEPSIFLNTNIIGTHTLLEAAIDKKIRFHHVSTDEVFGSLELDEKNKFSEKTNYNPRSPYAASKASSDHLVRAYYYTYDLPITISNTENNYGPYMYPEKLLSLAITNLINGKKVPIYGDGKNIRDWLYVEDHCRGIDLILKKGKPGETYCIGGLTQDVNNLELIKHVLKIMKKDEDMLEFIKDRPGHDRRYAVDWTKAKEELGYEPQFDLDLNLKRMIEWYQNNEWWWRAILEKKDHQEYIKKQYKDRK